MVCFNQHPACASNAVGNILEEHSMTNVKLLLFAYSPSVTTMSLSRTELIASLVFCLFLSESVPPKQPSWLNPGRCSLQHVLQSSQDYRPAETERQ